MYCLDHLRDEVRGGWFRSTPKDKIPWQSFKKNAVRDFFQGFFLVLAKINSTYVAILFVGSVFHVVDSNIDAISNFGSNSVYIIYLDLSKRYHPFGFNWDPDWKVLVYMTLSF